MFAALRLWAVLNFCSCAVPMQQPDLSQLSMPPEVFRGLALAAAFGGLPSLPQAAASSNWTGVPGLRLTNGTNTAEQPLGPPQLSLPQSAPSVASGEERPNSSRRRTKRRKHCRDEESQSSADEDDADSDTDNQKWSRNYTKLGGANNKASYPRSRRFKIAAEILGSRLKPLKHAAMSLKELDMVIFVGSSIPPEYPLQPLLQMLSTVEKESETGAADCCCCYKNMRLILLTTAI